jgi:type VI secretion system protein ImpK
MTFSRQDTRRLASGTSGVEPALSSGSSGEPDIRALLADTALLVSTLKAGGETSSVAELRARCMTYIRTLSDELERYNVPAGVRRDAMLAQCALLDESVLACLKGETRSAWDSNPLQVECFNRHDAGSYVFERLEARMRETSPDAGLLEAYAAILGLGFNGRYVLDPEGRRQVVAALDAMLTRLGRGSQPAFTADGSRTRVGDWFRRLSPWGVFALGCIVAGIVYAVWNGRLSVLVSSLQHVKS